MKQQSLSFNNRDDAQKLYVREEGGAYVEATSAEILATARKSADELLIRLEAMDMPATVGKFLVAKLGGMEHEVAAVLFLDNQLKLIEYKEMFDGTVSQASVYPREIAKTALLLNASAIIISHNHPSGLLQPSSADIKLTNVLKDSLNLIDVRLLDHVIVAGSDYISLANEGHM